MKLAKGGKVLVKTFFTVAIVSALGYGLNKAIDEGYFNTKKVAASEVPKNMDISVADSTISKQTSTVAIETAKSSQNIKVLTIPWNATMGLHYANNGVTTKKGSLLDKRGLNVTLERQDDYSQILAEQIKFAQQVAKGKQPTDGAAFAIIMGDGYPAYIAGAQEALSKIGQQLEVVGAIGYSRGEDKCMLPIEVKNDPQKARGSLIGAVLRDGDWNICVKYASDNDIPVNPDETTYDPNAMNFISVDSFVKSDENLIAGYCETRPVISNGKLTGEKRKVCQNGTATWTPGDVKVAREIGGFASVASTKEYRWQMPAVVIGNKQWMNENPTVVTNFLAAVFEGGEIVRENDQALTQASEVAAKVYNEETPDYWKKYYKGVTERDKKGYQISLGGSTSIGLGDNAFLFGLQGNDNLYKRVYTVFGNIASKYYPAIMPNVVKYEQVVNPKYIQTLLDKSVSVAEADKPMYVENAPTTGTFAKKSVSIEFETGKTTFTPQAVNTLNEIINQLAISGNEIQINGHTDNVGNPTSNLVLSKGRADAVKSWLVANAPSNFPSERIRTRGFGDTSPIADNNTPQGKAKNRRVDIIILN